MKLQNTNDHLMVMAAARYCIGRRTYIVSACIEFLTQVWEEELNKEDRAVILRDIIEYLQDYGEADSYDANWRFFAQSKFDVLTEEEKETFRKNNAYRNKPFPL